MNILMKIQAYFAIKAACKKAINLQKTDGTRRFVIPFSDGNMDVLTVNEALTLKAQNVLPKDLSRKTIYGASFFWTDTNNRTNKVQGQMPKFEERRRRKAFYAWFERHHSRPCF